MVTRSSVVVGQSQPDMTLAQFTAVLDAGSSPALADADKCYQAITQAGVSVAFALAIFKKESTFGQEGFAVANKNPGNTRSSTTGIGFEVTTVKGQFIRYPNWPEGFRDMTWRLVKPDYVYAQEGRKTIEQIIERWAPPSENDTELYISQVVDSMNGWVKPMAVATEEKPDIEWRGSPNFWQGRWGEQVVAICDHIMQGTMESTDGWFKNPKSQVSSTFGVAKDGRIWQWVSLADTHWANGILQEPDMSIPWLAECANKGYNPNKRTVSIEHEGWYTEAMPEAQYQATLGLHKWLLAQFPWIMPDRKHIIGHYQVMKYEKQNCPGPNYPWTRLMSDLAGWRNATTTSTAGGVKLPDNVITLNDHALGHGFLDFFNKYGGVRFFGLPTSDEYTNADTGCTEQKFERYWMEFDPREKNPDWQIRGKIITGYLPK